MITVHYYPHGSSDVHSTEQFNQPNVKAKILASGVLKITVPAIFEVPPIGSEKDDAIIKTPEKLLAIFNGNYKVQIQ